MTPKTHYNLIPQLIALPCLGVFLGWSMEPPINWVYCFIFITAIVVTILIILGRVKLIVSTPSKFFVVEDDVMIGIDQRIRDGRCWACGCERGQLHMEGCPESGH